MKANDVYVIERLVNLNFLRHLLLLIVLHHQLLRYDLARICLTRCDIDDLVALCKASLDDDRDVQYGKSSWLRETKQLKVCMKTHLSKEP